MVLYIDIIHLYHFLLKKKKNLNPIVISNITKNGGMASNGLKIFI